MSTTQSFNNQGLNDEQVAKSRATYGANLLTPPPQTPWWKLYIEKFKDPIIIILLFATAISLVVASVRAAMVRISATTPTLLSSQRRRIPRIFLLSRILVCLAITIPPLLECCRA